MIALATALLALASPPTVVLNAAPIDALVPHSAVTVELRAALIADGAAPPSAALVPILDGTEVHPEPPMDLGPVQQSYARFDYGSAERALVQAERATLEAVPWDIEARLARTWFWRGVLSLARGRDATKAFGAVKSLDPSFVVDPVRWPPPVQAAFARAEAARAKTPTIRVDPKSASVRVVALQPGLHLVIARQAGLRPVARPARGDLQLRLTPESRPVALARGLAGARRAKAGTVARLQAFTRLRSLLGAGRVAAVESGAVARIYDLDRATISRSMNPAEVSTALSLAEPAVAGAGALDGGSAWYEHWWVWAIVGAAVGGGVTGAVLATRPDAPPSTFECCGP